MTEAFDIHRRHLLFAGAGLTGAALASPGFAVPGRKRLNISDPAVALDAYVKLRGSNRAETVFQTYEGDIFAVTDGKAPLPLLGFKGIQKSLWKPDGQGGFTNADYDIGFYVDYTTRRIIKEWRNPITGRTVEVFHYRGGPSGGHFRVGASGGDVYGDLVGGRWSVVGDHIWHTSSISGERPNPMKPKDWPLASSGESLLGSMSLCFACRVSDILDPAVHQAPGYQIWTNTNAWMPWMEMGQRPGFNEWRWIGAKGIDPAVIDPELIAAAEQVWPGYVSKDSIWKEPTSARTDYMRLKQGLPLTR